MQLFILSIVLFTLAVSTSSTNILLKNIYVPAKDLNKFAKLIPLRLLPLLDSLTFKYILLRISI
jgi:hypothetical protein